VRLWRDPPAGPEADLAVDVDPAAVGRALRNLLVNAIRHTPSDGTVQVLVGGVHNVPAYTVDGPVDSVDGAVDNAMDGGFRPVDAAALIAVQDTCGGIPAHDLPRIFEVGYRGEAARTPACTGRGGQHGHAGDTGHAAHAGPDGHDGHDGHDTAPGQGVVGVGGSPGIVAGAGLGLTIARGIVEAHRGQVSVANVAAGCRFVVQLPLAHAGVGVDGMLGGPGDERDTASGGGTRAGVGRDGVGRPSGRRAGRGSGGRHEIRGSRRAGRRRP
jgi:signal transduction histidine kinase